MLLYFLVAGMEILQIPYISSHFIKHSFSWFSLLISGDSHHYYLDVLTSGLRYIQISLNICKILHPRGNKYVKNREFNQTIKRLDEQNYQQLQWEAVDLNWRRRWHPTPVLWPGKSHGWRSLVGCSPWGRSESDRTERLHFHFSLSSIGEGNGNPLQCSCLENPRDGGAWWAAVYGVAQSRTRLKRLSSSSSSRLKLEELGHL